MALRHQRRNAILARGSFLFLIYPAAVVLSFLLKLRTRAQEMFRLSEAHTMLVWSVVVGVAGALATIAFRQAISLLQLAISGESGSFVEMARHMPWTVRVWLPAAGGLIAGFLLLIARRHTDKNTHIDYM
jgi:CIC family chloride channel protein